MITPKEYQTRRQRVFDAMENNSIAFIPTALEKERNFDNPYPYRPGNNFYYLTGFNEPEALAVLMKTSGKETFILFNRPNNPALEQWLGKFAGQQGAMKEYLADEAFDIAELEKKLPELLAGRDHLYYAWGRDHDFDKLLSSHVHAIEERARMNVKGPHVLHNIETIVHEMRLIKSPAEIEMMRYSAEVDAKAHLAAIQTCKPGMYEYELQAELTYVMQQHGCHEYAYTPIVAAGENACVLHYMTNKDKVGDNDLVLIDAGCEYGYYASDITRTFPANGKFSAEQKAIYETVLTAQLAGTESLKPGISRQEFFDTVFRTLTEGLVSLGLLEGKLDKLMADKAYRKFMPHGVGHWLGLDTHDVGSYMVDKKPRILEAGMATTNEPGIYINSNMEGVDKKWWGIGVRIEDDIVITENGCDVLSKDVPKSVNDIEQLMS